MKSGQELVGDAQDSCQEEESNILFVKTMYLFFMEDSDLW